MKETSDATGLVAEQSRHLSAEFRSLTEQSRETPAQMTGRLSNLRRTQELMPQSLNCRLLLKLRAEFLHLELERDSAPPPRRAAVEARHDVDSPTTH